MLSLILRLLRTRVQGGHVRDLMLPKLLMRLLLLMRLVLLGLLLLLVMRPAARVDHVVVAKRRYGGLSWVVMMCAQLRQGYRSPEALGMRTPAHDFRSARDVA